MANFRLYSTNLVPVWNEGTQQYDYVPEKAWVAAGHVILQPWYQVWYYQTPETYWDNGSQQYVPLCSWLPYKPNTQPPGFTLLAQPTGNTTKKNTYAEVLMITKHFADTIEQVGNAADLMAELVTGASTAAIGQDPTVTQGQFNQVVADMQQNIQLSFDLATNAAVLAQTNIQFALVAIKGELNTLTVGFTRAADAVDIAKVAVQMQINISDIATTLSLLSDCVAVADSQLQALMAIQAPPDVVAQAMQNLQQAQADLQNTLTIGLQAVSAAAAFGLAAFGYGGMYSGGLNNTAAPGIFSGGDDPDDGGAAVSATGDCNGSLDAP